MYYVEVTSVGIYFRSNWKIL